MGIPKELRGLAEPFEFNNKKDFEKKFLKNVKKISCVVLEPARAQHCDLSFVKTIRNLCTKFNVPLIFDEITLGWHYTLGGYHKIIKIDPDSSIF